MAPSQLKSLKASLRTQGVLGPSKSKSEKKNGLKERTDKKIHRNNALSEIRDQFNPFEAKYLSRGPKHEFAGSQRPARQVVGRPGVTKGMGEEVRRATLLKEMHQRRKVGGVVDRRFGEDDPSMGPEEKALARFMQEKQRGHRKSSMYNLEDDDGEIGELTHMGQSLFSGAPLRDDFDVTSLEGSDEDPDAEGAARGEKRRRTEADNEILEQLPTEDDHDLPDRPKTKQEVMKEVMAKSKLHKFERQKAKEDDDELRAELDDGLQDIYSFLQKSQKKPAPRQVATPVEPTMNPDRAAQLHGNFQVKYENMVRELASDARSRPTQRTKTEEEIAADEAARLQQLEAQRLRRMAGEEEPTGVNDGADHDDFEDLDEPNILGGGIRAKKQRELDVEDEDDFVLDDDLIASESSDDDNAEEDLSSVSSEESPLDEDGPNVLDSAQVDGETAQDEDTLPNSITQPGKADGAPNLPYTYPCPASHAEFLSITKGIAADDLPTLVQRIRLLYNIKLAAENKAKLARFAAILVEHVPHLTNQAPQPSFTVLEALIRHVHSLAKTFPIEVATAYRDHLVQIHEKRPLDLNAGDLVVLTGIGSTFSTSDHFHQVATPAMMTMARYLGQKIPRSISDLAKGLYLCSLCLQYQELSKRYVPEVVNYLLNALQMLSPAKPNQPFGPYPSHDSSADLRINTKASASTELQPPDFWLVEHDKTSSTSAEDAKLSLLSTTTRLTDLASSLWQGLSSYPEIFAPFFSAFTYLRSSRSVSHLPGTIKTLLKSTNTTLETHISAAKAARKPLTLHNHRPLPIKTSIPKFEESFRPDKHYDPDRARAESAKLRKEHKRERKGALRELRKDSAFVARESLKEKKAADRAYEEKFRKLVASINEEGGREANEYGRNRKARKGKK